jgi:hypothetical protein
MSKAHIQALLNDASEQVVEAHLASDKINKHTKQNSSEQRYVVAIIQNRAKEVSLQQQKLYYIVPMHSMA